MSTPCDLIPPDLRGKTCPHRDAIFFNTTTVADIQKCLAEMKQEAKGDAEEIKKSIKEIADNMEKKYVSKDQFYPVQKVVYGLVTVVLLSVVGAVIALILK